MVNVSVHTVGYWVYTADALNLNIKSAKFVLQQRRSHFLNIINFYYNPYSDIFTYNITEKNITDIASNYIEVDNFIAACMFNIDPYKKDNTYTYYICIINISRDTNGVHGKTLHDFIVYVNLDRNDNKPKPIYESSNTDTNGVHLAIYMLISSVYGDKITRFIQNDTQLITQNITWDERYQKSKVIVFGCCYAPHERNKWGQLDNNYIGIGQPYHISHNIPGNKFEFEWNMGPNNWPNEFKELKKYDIAILDYGVIHDINNRTMHVFEKILQCINVDGILLIHSLDELIFLSNIVPYPNDSIYRPGVDGLKIVYETAFMLNAVRCGYICPKNKNIKTGSYALYSKPDFINKNTWKHIDYIEQHMHAYFIKTI